VKQPDTSYVPATMPNATRVNAIKLDPLTGQCFPTFVFETAVEHETLQQLLADAANKAFSRYTSICCWLGAKIQLRDLGDHVFWVGWGRRRPGPGIMDGLLLEQECQDDAGYATFLPVHTNIPLLGALRIPTNLIFGPAIVPPGLPTHYILPFEEVRIWIDTATRRAGL
jgi:hypothetical protein